MSEIITGDLTSAESTKPAENTDVVKFPPFPEPEDGEFEEDISEDERNFYKMKFPDLNAIKFLRLHCTACDRHLGCSARNESRMRSHPMLRTLVCHTCHTFYNSGEFDKGDDGSELYCRWCGQGGQVYCCSDCPHVFCAKCIKRNLGLPKIKEIENMDDWKCFKCNNRPLWDLRAICWALLRFCDLKNKMAYKTEDPELKELLQRDCTVDHTDCCKNKSRRKTDTKKKDDKKEVENVSKKADTASVISKIPPTIQVKKFASINLEDIKPKPQKRSLSPRNKVLVKSPATIVPSAKIISPVPYTPPAKRMRAPNSPLINPIRIHRERPPTVTYARIRPKPPHLPMLLNNQYNGYNNQSMFQQNMLVNDNINLSLESLTQGLDMAAVAALANNQSNQDDDVVCTPDFPLEPLCEVTEDNTDDDVQCITPGPIAAPKPANPPPLARIGAPLPELSVDNIIQMTENDVTVNAVTGGLKFRVDPQTLSSNKMYRLPDGRIFAINANPNMPGGYSATIVAVTETNSGKITPKGATYAAKLSAVTSQPNATNSKPNKQINRGSSSKRNTNKMARVTRSTARESTSRDSIARECDLNVPVEWYRYNLIDAVDALEFSLGRLQKLKKEATTLYLRTRSINEMKVLHRTLDRLLHTSSSRFREIRDNLNKEMKQYVNKKMGSTTEKSLVSEDDDDDVEILNDLEDNDDPIFIDENSVESHNGANETEEVDLTAADKSNEQNDSFENDPLSNTDINADEKETNNIDENGTEKEEIKQKLETNADFDDSTTPEINGNEDNPEKMDVDNNEKESEDADAPNSDCEKKESIKASSEPENPAIEKSNIDESVKDVTSVNNSSKEEDDINDNLKEEDDINDNSKEEVEKNRSSNDETEETVKDKAEVNESVNDDAEINESVKDSDINEDKINDIDMIDDKIQDTDLSDDMIMNLLKEDSGTDDVDNLQNTNCSDDLE